MTFALKSRNGRRHHEGIRKNLEQSAPATLARGGTNVMKATEQRKKRRWRSYYGVEQKSLHVKMYFDVLEILDKESAVDGMPRNALINQACEYYCKQLDEERRGTVMGKARKCTPNGSITNQVTAELTPKRYEQLVFIASTLGYSIDHAAKILLERAVVDYFGRPFAYP